jgi:DNA-binding NarL/FixJ family response regulator
MTISLRMTILSEDIARIVPTVRDLIQVQLSPPGDAEEDRRRSLESVLDFLRRAAAAQPMLSADWLTIREREVAGLLAAGRNNRQIAEAPVITEGTAEVQVRRVLSRLGLRSRAQVAARVAEQPDRGPS